MKKLYRNDIILNIIIILICIAIPVAIGIASNGEKTLVISYDGDVVKEISLMQNEAYNIHGVEVTVENGTAFVSETNCPDRLCMKMSKAKNVGDSIICVPNKVSVRIVGRNDAKGADVVAG